MMKLDRKRAELELERAGKLNPGKWTDHSRYTAQACENIAARCDGMSPDTAYCYGLLHDIGRYAGVTSEKHLIDGYRFCMEHFVKNAVYDDYDRLVQLCDSLALPSGFCLLEKRFVDVALRYGTPPVMAERWRRTLEIKEMFDEKINGFIYELLPGVEENTFR